MWPTMSLRETDIGCVTRLRGVSAANNQRWIRCLIGSTVRLSSGFHGYGTTAAYLLKKVGLSVALIDRERVASIDTGHTTAHLTYVTDVELQE
jgi:hypothetical protein